MLWRWDPAYLVHIADDPLLGECEVDGKISALVEANAPRSVVDSPVIVCAAIVSQLVLRPAVGPGRHALSRFGPVAAKVVDVPRVDIVGSRGQLGICHLILDGMIAVVVHVGISKAPNASYSTQIVVKYTVLITE